MIDSGPPGEPAEPRQVRTSFAFTVNPQEPDYGMFLILDEDPAARGQFAGTMVVEGAGLYGGRVLVIEPTTATMDGSRELHIAAGQLEDSFLIWDSIDLQLGDQDGDGVLESGTGRIEGTVFAPNGFQDDFTAAPDGFPTAAWAYRSWSPSNEMLPWETIIVALRQPVTSDQLQRHRVLANGQEVPGQIEPFEAGALHTGFIFTPDAFYPLGATIEVELDGMENAVGAPVTLEHDPLLVQADPGSILPNLGFEQTLAGWYTAGDAVVLPGAGDQLPVEGAGMAALRSAMTDAQHSDSRLIGYFDVPVDATTLDVSLALLTPEEELPRSITMRLYHDLAEGGYEVLDGYEFDHAAAVFEPCDCDELGVDPPLTRRAGPFRQQIDLSALRGERVFLEIQLDGNQWFGPSQLAVAPLPPPPPPVPAILLVDDLQLR